MISIKYIPDLEEVDIAEAISRGVLSGIEVNIDGIAFDVTVFSPDRMKYTIDMEMEKEHEMFMSPGTIVLNSELNVANIEAAILKMAAAGYFGLLKPKAN